MDKSCKCDGMNADCMFCGGSGFIIEKKIEIIRTVIDKSKTEKQNIELQSYLHPREDKMYETSSKSQTSKDPKLNRAGRKKGQSQPLKKNKIDKNHFRNGRNKIKKEIKVRKEGLAKEKNINAKVETPTQLEFLSFWKNNIQRHTKNNEEFQKCLSLFVELKETKREKFKHGILKNHSLKGIQLIDTAQELFNKLME